MTDKERVTRVHLPKIERPGKAYLLVAAAMILLAGSVAAVSLTTYFRNSVSVTIASRQITLDSISSTGFSGSKIACTPTLPRTTSASGEISESCTLSATQGDVGTITVSLKTNTAAGFSVSVLASETDGSSPPNFTFTNPPAQTVGSSVDIIFNIGVAVSSTASSSATFQILVQA